MLLLRLQPASATGELLKQLTSRSGVLELARSSVPGASVLWVSGFVFWVKQSKQIWHEEQHQLCKRWIYVLINLRTEKSWAAPSDSSKRRAGLLEFLLLGCGVRDLRLGYVILHLLLGCGVLDLQGEPIGWRQVFLTYLKRTVPRRTMAMISVYST